MFERDLFKHLHKEIIVDLTFDIVYKSNCNGLSGLIRIDDDHYFIEPLWNHTSTSDQVHPHVIFKQDTNAKFTMEVTPSFLFI